MKKNSVLNLTLVLILISFTHQTSALNWASLFAFTRYFRSSQVTMPSSPNIGNQQSRVSSPGLFQRFKNWFVQQPSKKEVAADVQEVAIYMKKTYGSGVENLIKLRKEMLTLQDHKEVLAQALLSEKAKTTKQGDEKQALCQELSKEKTHKQEFARQIQDLQQEIARRDTRVFFSSNEPVRPAPGFTWQFSPGNSSGPSQDEQAVIDLRQVKFQLEEECARIKRTNDYFEANQTCVLPANATEGERIIKDKLIRNYARINMLTNAFKILNYKINPPALPRLWARPKIQHLARLLNSTKEIGEDFIKQYPSLTNDSLEEQVKKGSDTHGILCTNFNNLELLIKELEGTDNTLQPKLILAADTLKTLKDEECLTNSLPLRPAVAGLLQ